LWELSLSVAYQLCVVRRTFDFGYVAKDFIMIDLCSNLYTGGYVDMVGVLVGGIIPHRAARGYRAS
jgi:hypothetical protein